VHNLKKEGIDTHAFFIIGFPGEKLTISGLAILFILTMRSLRHILLWGIISVVDRHGQFAYTSFPKKDFLSKY